MATITTRVQGDSPKGSPLTNAEVDNNFINLNTAKYESGDSPSFSALTVAGTLGNFNVSSGANQVTFDYNGFNYINSTGAGSAIVVRMGSTYANALRFDSDGKVTINDDGNDQDFRVESDANTHALMVEASSGRVGINDSTPDATLDIVNAASTDYMLRLDYGANYQGLNFKGSATYGNGTVEITNLTTPGSGTAHAFTWFKNNGTIGSGGATRHSIKVDGYGYFGHGISVNEDGYDSDFRVETATNANMLVVDSGNNWVRINEGGGQATVDSFITEGAASINGFRVIRGQSWGSWTANTDYYLCSMNPGSNGSSAAANIDILATGANVSASFRIVAKNAGGTTSPYAYCTGTNTSTLQLVAYRDNSNVAVIHFYVRPTSSVSYTPRTTVTGHGSVIYDPSAPSAAVDDDWVWSSDSVFANKIGVGTSSPSGAMEVHTSYGTSTAFYVSQKKTYGAGTGIAENARVVLSIRESGAASDREFADFKAQTVQETSSTDGRLTVSTRQNGALVERMVMEPGTTIFNETSQNQDFRVESDANAHMLFVDGGANHVSIGTSSDLGGLLNVAGSIALGGGRESRDTDGNGSVGSSDALNYLKWAGRTVTSTFNSGIALEAPWTAVSGTNWTNNKFRFHLWRSHSQDVLQEAVGSSSRSGDGDSFVFGNTNIASGAERVATGLAVDGRDMYLYGQYNLSLQAYNEVAINDQSQNADFRVESDANTHAIFVDASANNIGFGVSNGTAVFNGASVNPGIQFELGYGTIVQQTNGNANYYMSKASGYTNGTFMQFNVIANTVGSITTTTTGITFNTTSDRRLKENIETITDGTEKLMAMNPVTHTWKNVPDAPAVHGFIAQEMIEIVPEAVSGDPTGEEMMSMDYGRITPVLVAALQDAHKKIAELEARLNTLEGK